MIDIQLYRRVDLQHTATIKIYIYKANSSCILIGQYHIPERADMIPIFYDAQSLILYWIYKEIVTNIFVILNNLANYYYWNTTNYY